MPLRRERNEIVLRARALRRDMTLPEGMLWQVLRQRPEGLKFRRQHPLGAYVVDFYCPSAMLVIEVDGQSHSMGGRPLRDARRDGWLRAQGLRVIRLDAAEVLKDVHSIASSITVACRK